jgi:hypothetical protein
MATYWADFSQTHLGPIFRTLFPGEILGNIPRKIFPQKMLGKMEFSAEKVLKNRLFSAESDFPRKKMFEKSAPGVTLTPVDKVHPWGEIINLPLPQVKNDQELKRILAKNEMIDTLMDLLDECRLDAEAKRTLLPVVVNRIRSGFTCFVKKSPKMWPNTRVTRFCYFSPIGRLINLGIF